VASEVAPEGQDTPVGSRVRWIYGAMAIARANESSPTCGPAAASADSTCRGWDATPVFETKAAQVDPVRTDVAVTPCRTPRPKGSLLWRVPDGGRVRVTFVSVVYSRLWARPPRPPKTA